MRRIKEVIGTPPQRGLTPSYRRSDRGFSLVELSATVVVVGILSAIAVPVFSTMHVSAATGALKTDLQHAATQLELDKIGNGGAYPALPASTASQR